MKKLIKRIKEALKFKPIEEYTEDEKNAIIIGGIAVLYGSAMFLIGFYLGLWF